MLSVMLTAGGALAAGAKKNRLTFPARYEGGTLQLDQGRIKATVVADEMLLTQGNQRLAVAFSKITAIFCVTDARYRMGAFVLGRVPLIHRETVEAYYVGLSWTGEKESTVKAVLRLSGGDYRDFVTTLERMTGMKATDTGKIPTIVRYGM